MIPNIDIQLMQPENLQLLHAICCDALFKVARSMPAGTDPATIEADRKRSKKLNYVSTGEGLGILLGINIVNNIGHHELACQLYPW